MKSERIACAAGELGSKIDRSSAAPARLAKRMSLLIGIASWCELCARPRLAAPGGRPPVALPRREYKRSRWTSTIFASIPASRIDDNKQLSAAIHLGRFIERKGDGQYSVVEENPSGRLERR